MEKNKINHKFYNKRPLHKKIFVERVNPLLSYNDNYPDWAIIQYPGMDTYNKELTLVIDVLKHMEKLDKFNNNIKNMYLLDTFLNMFKYRNYNIDNIYMVEHRALFQERILLTIREKQPMKEDLIRLLGLYKKKWYSSEIEARLNSIIKRRSYLQ